MKLIDKNSKTEKSVEFICKNEGLKKRQIEILELLEKQDKMSLIDFEKIAKTTIATINKLESLGCVRVLGEEKYRNPLVNL